ncbi:MAG: AAA family ATPase [Clostridia bacterium]
MGKVITFSNQKGGVGKTTTAINLAAIVATMGKKICLIDLDSQGNATSGYGFDKNNLPKNTYDFLMRDCKPSEVVFKTQIDNLHLIPANIDLAAAEVDLVNVPRREYALKTAIAPILNAYDYIFIDCPPSLGLLTLNALTAADSVVIPIQSEFFALEGLSQLMNTIKIVKQRLNPQLSINGVVLTMYDNRSLISKQVTDEIQKFFGDKVYKYPVPRNIKLVEAPSFGVPITVHAPHSNGAIAYTYIAQEFLQREEDK